MNLVLEAKSKRDEVIAIMDVINIYINFRNYKSRGGERCINLALDERVR